MRSWSAQNWTFATAVRESRVKRSTNQRGEFTVPDLAPGPYEVTITHNGFRTVRQTDIVLEMDQVARMDFKLEVGAVSQSVEVIERRAPDHHRQRHQGRR